MEKISEKPEYTAYYPAVDGIEVKDHPDDFSIACKPIRGDIEEGLFKMENTEFDNWCLERREAAQTLLNMYELVASVPALSYREESMQYNMNAYSDIASSIGIFKKTLDYLEKLEERRGDYRAANISVGCELVKACKEFNALMQIRGEPDGAKPFEDAKQEFYDLLRSFEDRDDLVYVVETHADRLEKLDRSLVFDTYDMLMESEENE